MNMSQSRFFCTECGREGVPIIRKAGQQRESGHLKKLYCLYCQKEVNHAEIRDSSDYGIEDFRKEFELGRFVNGQRIEIGKLAQCTNENCPFNINGRCWNSTQDHDCGHRILEKGDDLG